MESIQIHLNSRFATTKYNLNAGDAEFQLPIINVPPDCYIHLSVVSAVLPYSFYNINANNNIFKYQLIGSEVTNIVTVPIGNYNINNLLSYLNLNAGNDLVFTYNSITNKVNFTNATSDFVLIHTELLKNLGFPDGYSSFYTSNVTSPNCVNLYTITNINIETNLITYNVCNVPNQKTSQTILANIPIMTNPNGLIFYENLGNYKTNLYVGELSLLRIRLMDNDGRLVDMNGCDYNITLQIDSVPF